jgi:hypothetical protein
MMLDMCEDPDPGDSTPLSDEDAMALKMVLGEYGIQILVAIQRGARTPETIPLFSGVPKACVSGRMPVILNLGLATEAEEFALTERGLTFLEKMGYCV